MADVKLLKELVQVPAPHPDLPPRRLVEFEVCCQGCGQTNDLYVAFFDDVGDLVQLNVKPGPRWRMFPDVDEYGYPKWRETGVRQWSYPDHPKWGSKFFWECYQPTPGTLRGLRTKFRWRCGKPCLRLSPPVREDRVGDLKALVRPKGVPLVSV